MRPFDDRDIAAINKALGDPDIQRWFGKSELSAVDFLERKRRDWSAGTSASFAVCDAPDVSTCLAQVFMEPGEDARAEVGYWLHPTARGSGRAARAVALLSLWAFREVGIARLQLWAEPTNDASVRVAERSGFQKEGVLRSFIEREGFRRDVIFYSLLPSDVAAHGFADPS